MGAADGHLVDFHQAETLTDLLTEPWFLDQDARLGAERMADALGTRTMELDSARIPEVLAALPGVEERCTAQQMLDLRVYFRMELRRRQRSRIDVSANLAASMDRLYS